MTTPSPVVAPASSQRVKYAALVAVAVNLAWTWIVMPRFESYTDDWLRSVFVVWGATGVSGLLLVMIRPLRWLGLGLLLATPVTLIAHLVGLFLQVASAGS